MSQLKSCTVCTSSFVVRFSYQVQRTLDKIYYFCSQDCHERHLCSEKLNTCSECSKEFEFLYAYQQMNIDGVNHHFCSERCRKVSLTTMHQRQNRMKRIAVLNQKGGTGKTTTSVNVAAALADLGKRVLLIDLDAQSNVSVSLGLTSPRTISDILMGECHPADCVINVSENFDAIISSPSLSTVETYLIQLKESRNEVLKRQMKPVTNYDVVILDCSPNLSVLAQNTLTYVDQLLIPVSCDYLSLVGVRNIMRTLKTFNEVLLSHVDVLGVVPTFYGLSEQCTFETMRSLQAFFQDKVLHPVRVDPALRQAPMHKQTIFEYDSLSKGAEDYRRLARQIFSRLTAEHTVSVDGNARIK
jgi:chromosome partitioning protein